MKEVFFINDTAENKISYYHLLAFLASLPFDRLFSQVVFISLIIHTLIHLKKRKGFTINKTVLIPATIYLLFFVSFFYSQDRANAFKELGRQLPILIFPLFFSYTDLDFRKYRMRLLIFFSMVCTFTVLYLLFDSLRVIVENNLSLNALLSAEFINHNFSAPIGMHATYLSMFVALSLVSCLYFFVTASSFLQKIIYGLAICILAAGLILLSSRAVIMGLCFILAVFPFLVLKEKKRIKYSIAVAAILLLGFLGTMKIDALRTRFISDLSQELTKPPVERNVISESRVARWKCAQQLVKKSPVIGYGIGSEKRLLKEKYFEQKLYNSYINSLDAHNQYLSFLLKTGIIGLGLFIFVLFSGFKAALLEKDIFFTGFLVLVAVVSVSENILDVNKGIFFFSFFFSLFFVRQSASLKQ